MKSSKEEARARGGEEEEKDNQGHEEGEESFDRLMKRAMSKTGGDNEKALELLFKEIAVAFCIKVVKDRKAEATMAKKKEKNGGEKELASSSSLSIAKKSLKRCNEEKGIKKTEKKSRKIFFSALAVPDMAMDLKERIIRKGGTDIKLVITKILCETDLKKRNNRFSIPLNQVVNSFLTPEEEEWLKRHEDKHCQGIDVTLIEPSLKETAPSEICLKRWEMKTSSIYVLIAGWNAVVARNLEVLQEDAIVQLWSFRVNGELWFQLIRVEGGLIDGANSSSAGEDGAGTSKSPRDKKTLLIDAE